MKTINHTYFGTLNFDIQENVGYIWEGEINHIDVALWYDQSVAPKEQTLDIFADFLNNIEKYKKKAMSALVDYLKEDDEYITFHIEELEIDFPKNAKDFVQEMTLTHIGLWMDNESIIMDFMISPEESDEILAVTFDKTSEITDIAWES